MKNPCPDLHTAERYSKHILKFGAPFIMSTVPDEKTPNGVTEESKNQEAVPITNATVAPEDKKKKLVRKQLGPNPIKYKLWLAGHITTIVFGTVSLVFQLFWLRNRYYINSISYRLAFVGAVTALTATLSHKFSLRYLPPGPTLIAQQNFQYLTLAFIWIFTFKSVFKIIPYFLISILQLGAHKKIAAITNQGPFLASIIAFDELFLIFYLLLRTILFRSTSGYQLSVFLLFYWLRILFDKETGNLFRVIVQRLDGKILGVKNPKVQHIWTRVKEFLDSKQHDVI